MNLFNRLFGKNAPKPKEPAEEGSSSGEAQEKLDRLLEILEKFKRTAYLPGVEESKPSFSPHSKIGGFPYLRNPEDWPVCPNCAHHMQLFLQLDLRTIPEKQQDGLVQLFYCTNGEADCECKLEAFFPFSEGSVCRLVKAEGESARISPVLDHIFSEKRIVSWTARDDYPDFEEYESLGLDLDIDDELYELMDQTETGIPICQDKLFGWPLWVQSQEYPNDRETGVQMEFLFQFLSESNLPYLFGDVGIGHLSQSPDNPEELGFGWACS